MKKQIEKVQQYFKEKLLAGEFEVRAMDTYCASVLVDGFPFEVWIRGISEGGGSRPFEACAKYFITLPEFTDEEQEKMASIMLPIKNKWWETQGREAKLKQLEELKKELGEI